MPPTPFDPEAAATGGASTTSATKDIWGLGDYGSYDILYGQASAQRTGFGGYSRLPAYDREGSGGYSRAPGTQGPYMPGQPAASRPQAGQGVAVTKTVLELMQYFAGLAYTPKGEAEFLKWQRLLFKAGFYGSAKPSEVAWGSWAGSEDAFKGALISAAQAREAGAPVSLEEYLDKTGKDRDRAAKAFEEGQPKIREFENPRVVAGVLQQAAQSSLGRNLTKEEVDHFVSEYHAAEEAYYRSAESAQETPGLHNLTKPSLQAQADEFVGEGHGVEASGNQMADYVGVLEQLLGGV